MNPLSLTLWALTGSGLLTFLTLYRLLRPGSRPPGGRRLAIGLGLAALALGLQAFHALEFLLATGLHDLRSALFGLVASFGLSLAVFSLARPAP